MKWILPDLNNCVTAAFDVADAAFAHISVTESVVLLL